MSRLAAVVAAAAAASLAFPAVPSADPPRAEGRIDTDEGRIEILGRPVRVGERIDLPEGWIRVEEKGTEDENVGSFGIVPAESLHAVGAPTQHAPAGAGDPAPATPGRRDCRAERAAYLAELWKEAGVEVSSPDALLEGLEAGASGPETGYYWFALQTDPFRPLAWSAALRERADALVRCVRGG
jgi:hypothetical protein